MRKLLTLAAMALVLTAVALSARPHTASASGFWCYDDPTVVINGRVAHVELGVPEDQVGAVVGSTLTIVVPKNVNAQVSDANTGVPIGRLKVVVTLVHSNEVWDGVSPVNVSAFGSVVAKASFPASLVATINDTPVATATGKTNRPLSLSFSM